MVAYKSGIVPMTQSLGLSPLDQIRRDRLNQLCDLYAEALDKVVQMMVATPRDHDEERPEPPPVTVN